MHQYEDIIRSACNVMRFKRLTAEQLKYIWNTVICPRINFRAQLSVLSNSICNRLTSIFRVLFKQKLHLPKSFPSAVLHSRELLGINHLFDQQLLAKSSDVYNQLNAKGLLKKIVLIQERKLQTRLILPLSPFHTWPETYPRNVISKNLLALSIALLKTHDITIKQCASSKNAIIGGSHPLIDILNFNCNVKY